MANVTETEIKRAVRQRYADLADGRRSCCASDRGTLSGDSTAPKEAVETSASCGSPVAQANVMEGEVVLDLGSGAGADVFRASKLVGATGKVIGVDATPEMIFKAREIAQKYGYRNVEFRLGEIEHLPVEDGYVDLVISNCVINLIPDKATAFREIYRVVKPGGRLVISDMVAARKQDLQKLVDPKDWAECISGAVTIDEYRDLLEAAGFHEVRYVNENNLIDETCCSEGLPVKSVTWFARKP